MSRVLVKDIYKKYGKQSILSGSSFYADAGECVGIVGANGCGKSTLLGIMAGSIRMTSGTIEYNGKNAIADKRTFVEQVGYVPQDNPLFDKLSVYDNLKFWYCDSDRNLKQDMVDGVPAQLGLDKYRDYAVNKLSGGMKKRLSIACALARHPSILILDEPGASLDVVCKEDIKNYLKSYINNYGTVIITSHEEGELALCDRMYLLCNGVLTELEDKPTGMELLERIRRINE